VTPLDVAVIMGTVRQERQTDRIAHWVCSSITRRPDMNARLIDLRAYPLPFFDEPAPPLSGHCAPAAADFARTLAPADAFVFVTPEYNHGVPAVLKNALDHLYGEWNRKPMAVVGYGGLYGGVRAVEALRQRVVVGNAAQVGTTAGGIGSSVVTSIRHQPASLTSAATPQPPSGPHRRQ
jgi:NAD(P)H-dependent FMN reductase